MAMGFIAFYALCLFAPTAALAFNGTSCLTEHTSQQVHSHAADAAHEHGDEDNHAGPVDDHDGDGSTSSKCCGMVFCSALIPDLVLVQAPTVISGRTSLVAWQDFSGLPPGKLIRPPRSQS